MPEDGCFRIGTNTENEGRKYRASRCVGKPCKIMSLFRDASAPLLLYLVNKDAKRLVNLGSGHKDFTAGRGLLINGPQHDQNAVLKQSRSEPLRQLIILGNINDCPHQKHRPFFFALFDLRYFLTALLYVLFILLLKSCTFSAKYTVNCANKGVASVASVF